MESIDTSAQLAQATPPSATAASAHAWFWSAALLLCVSHVVLCHHFLPFGFVFGSQPISGDDFDAHIGQTLRVVEGLEGWGKAWVYDVQLLAGQPEGTIFDGDNKGWELWTFALTKLGVSKAVGFNTFVLFAMLALPLVIFAAGRLFGWSRWASLAAAALASSLWFFDSFCHWMWYVGMVEYAFAAYLALLPLALFHRFVEHERVADGVSCGVALGVVLLIHPYVFFILAAPMALLYARSVRRLSRGGHAAVVGMVLFCLALNAYWLRAAFMHWHYVLDSAKYAQGGPRYFLADFLGILLKPDDTGAIGVRTGFRFLVLALGAAGLWQLREARDERFAPLVLAFIVMLGFSYLGPLIPFAGQIQPYRHVVPLVFLSTLLAGSYLEWLARERVLQRIPRAARVLGSILALGVAQHLAIDVLYFCPGLVPETAPLPDGTPSPIMKYGFIKALPDHSHIDYRHPRAAWLEGDAERLVEWVNTHVPSGGRLLVDSGPLGERLAWKTHAEVIGGFPERNVAHAYANFFRRYGDREVSPEQLSRYLRLFAVGWVITQKPRADFERATQVLERLPPVANRLVYRTRFPVSAVLSGPGRVHARTNRIEVVASDPGRDLLLSYHWHEALRCKPSCAVARAEVDLDAVGLIRIPAPHPADLTVFNSYAD